MRARMTKRWERGGGRKTERKHERVRKDERAWGEERERDGEEAERQHHSTKRGQECERQNVGGRFNNVKKTASNCMYRCKINVWVRIHNTYVLSTTSMCVHIILHLPQTTCMGNKVIHWLYLIWMCSSFFMDHITCQFGLSTFWYCVCMGYFIHEEILKQVNSVHCFLSRWSVMTSLFL